MICPFFYCCRSCSAIVGEYLDTSIDGNSTFETVVRKRAIAVLHSTIYLDAGPSIFGTDLVSLFVLSLSFVSVS